MVKKGSHFADFVRFRPHTYTRTQQSLPPFWAAIMEKSIEWKHKRKFSNLKIDIVGSLKSINLQRVYAIFGSILTQRLIQVRFHSGNRYWVPRFRGSNSKKCEKNTYMYIYIKKDKEDNKIIEDKTIKKEEKQKKLYLLPL